MALDREAADFIELVRKLGRPGYDSMTPEAARKLYKETRSGLSPEPPAMALVENMSCPGPHGPVAMRYYRPQGSAMNSVLPLLVFCHGGGWVIGDLDTHDVICRILARESEAAVLSVDYRMGPEFKFPAAVDDAYTAASWARREAARLKVDPERFAIGGDSAGGNLSAVVALLARERGDLALCLQALIYPATDMHMITPSHAAYAEGHLLTRQSMDWFQLHYLNGPEDRDDWRASPLRSASLVGLPPAIVIVAGNDPLRDEGVAYAEALRAAGNSVRFREFPGMVHGFVGMGRIMPQAGQALAEVGMALKEAFQA